MLIFVKGDYLPLIASGQKTTTIRPWKRCRLRPGQSVLSFNGKLRALVTHIEQRALGDLTVDELQRDGFKGRAAFERAFLAHYPHVTRATAVWVLHFRLMLPSEAAPSFDPPLAPRI